MQQNDARTGSAREIYLDHSATTEVCPAALDAYIAASREHWGNPSSRHGMGKDAEDIRAAACATLLESLSAPGGSVVFTSGGTEANNLAIFGRALAKPRFSGKKILTTAGEHASVTAPLAALRAAGFRVTELSTRGGVLDPDEVAREMTPDVILATVMAVNNETGAAYDTAMVSRLMKQNSPDAVLHVDATQAYLKCPLTVRGSGADLITVSSHKIEGPKGVGALWISPEVIRARGITARELGGGQEAGLRSGTENIPGIAAFAAAIRYESADFPALSAHLSALRVSLLRGLSERAGLREVRANLPPVAAPHIVSLTLPRIKSETALHFLSSRGIYVSSGSACSSHESHTSPAMVAFGLTEREADTTIRVSFGRENTDADVTAFLDALEEGVRTLIRVR